MSDNSRYQNLVTAYHKAYLSTATKQSRLIAAQNESNRVKKSSQDYDQLMLRLSLRSFRFQTMAFQWWEHSRKACMFVCITFFIEIWEISGIVVYLIGEYTEGFAENVQM